MITVMHEQQQTQLQGASAQGDALWVDRDQMMRATGWQWKPEGLCRGEVCVPLPRSGPPMVRDDRIDLAAAWRHMGNPVVHDAQGEAWVLGTGAQHRAQTLASGEAPDFELSDLAGRSHRLSDFRGRKVLLVTWASW